MKELRISQLTLEDVPSFSSLLQRDPIEYRQHFIPFSGDSEGLTRLFSYAVRDQYWGIFCGETLAGFFMLRGFDEGYERPSFGVYIAKNFANRGLSRLALDYSICWCRTNDIAAMVLKVHSENTYARRVYEKAGFRLLDVCPRTGHLIMELRWELL